MAITLTSDPIVSEADAKAFLATDDDTAVRLLINSVSAKFLAFTGRVAINKTASIVEYLRGLDDFRLWVHATPIDTTATVQVEILSDGQVDETLTLAASKLIVYATSGIIGRSGGLWPASYDEFNLKVTYTGGWSTVPGDIVSSALRQMKYERMRDQGLVGASSASRGGESITYETGDLLDEVRKTWKRYKVMV